MARPALDAFVHAIFQRGHPNCADAHTVNASADAILALDDSTPNGTCIDMCSKLPVVDPAPIRVPTQVLRGEFDGIAAIDTLFDLSKALPHPDQQFTVMHGVSHASFRQKNYRMAYRIVHNWPTQPLPTYTADVAH